MAVCPRCGTEVQTPIKTWELGRRKPVKIGLYQCPNCGRYFRAKVA